MHDLLSCGLAGLAVSGTLAFIAWLWSLGLRDASVVDPVWPFMIAGAGLGYAYCLPSSGERGFLALGLALVWAVRLGVHLAWRRRDHQGEDRRYQAIRARHEPRFSIKSLYLVFGLQAVLAWCVSAPLGVAWASGAPLRWLDMLGVAVALLGLAFEAIADAQLSMFRADPESRGTVLDQGLWRYSRHPNYFGEACFWWGMGLLALSGGGWAGLLSLLSPLLMTFLLLKVSGVGLLEADLLQRKGEAFQEYVASTPAFVPGRPRKDVA
jgi:steroid 5-alpha reductase family enzyme